MSSSESANLMEQQQQQQQILIEKLQQRDADGNTVLHLAVDRGNLTAVRWLLQQGHSPNVANFNGDTPLHSAAHSGWVDGVSSLLYCGANANATNIIGEAPLHMASSGGHLPVIYLLLKAGAFAGIADEEGDTPLHWAVREEQLSAVQYLVQFAIETRAFDPNTPNCDDETPLDLADDITPQNSDIVNVLVEAGINRRCVSQQKYVEHMSNDAIFSSSGGMMQKAAGAPRKLHSARLSSSASCSPDVAHRMSELSLQA